MLCLKPSAQVFIFETTGKIIKRHSTVHSQFVQLVKDAPRFEDDLRTFLGRERIEWFLGPIVAFCVLAENKHKLHKSAY
jgi:hypothetical protein